MKIRLTDISPCDMPLCPTLGDSKKNVNSLLTEKKCDVCGKIFYIRQCNVHEYVYKRFKSRGHGGREYYCGWNCMCKGEKEDARKREARKNRGLDE